MITRQMLNKKREAILEIAGKYGAHDVRIFGSVVRGENTEASDLDILVRFDPDRTLMDHAALIGKLEDLLGVKIDVIDADGMRPRFREVVEKEALLL
ncbi:MAG TPA: nucleotidyltransferase family protein [Phycisphaerae bacterium]|nr:nucleotidyltransferase family protein [Phycisphaerae bacterium]